MTKQTGVKIIPFGGCGEFGMNITIYQYKNLTFAVDAGVIFPDQRKLGISAVVPDMNYFKSLFPRIDAFIITHGHEDHIGALPYFQRAMPAPIYATPWTVELISSRFKQMGLFDKAKIHTVLAGEKVSFSDIQFEYIHVNHSIPDACSLLIKTPHESIYHTGDFRFDKNPPDGKKVDFEYLKQIGKEGVSLLLSDSTNAKSLGESLSESNVHKPLDKLIKSAKGRVFLTTFASNFWRLRTIYRICKNRNKKLFIAGRSIEKTFEIATKLKMFKGGEGVFVTEDKLKSIPEENLVILTTGSQGEIRAALSRIASREHRHFKVNKNDTLIFSSRVIPGNEKSIFHISSEFEKYGATVITGREMPDIHTSGHAYQNELKKLITLLKPKNYLPVHGTFSHLTTNQKLASEVTIPKDEGTPISNGDVLLVKGNKVSLIGSHDTQRMYVEADSQLTISHDNLQQRLKIGEQGLVIISGIINGKSNKFKIGPNLRFIGLPEASEVLISQTKKYILQDLQKNQNDLDLTKEELSEIVRISARRTLTNFYRKKPVVIPEIIFQ